jgi:hypothetical protein
MKQEPISRRHHFVPQGYLGAFTDSGDKSGKFFVHDVNAGRWFRTTPQNVAHRRDFNRFETESLPPDALEKVFAGLESDALRAIRRLVDSEDFPSPEDHNVILNFICLLAVRNPNMRESFNAFRGAVIERISDVLVSKKEIWEAQVRRAKEDGVEIDDGVPYERMRDVIQSRNYDLEFSPEGNLRVEMKAYERLLSTLGKRNWSVLLAPRAGPELVSGDHPVTLAWKGRKGPVGYGQANTEVFIPLTPHVGFYGTFEDPLKEIVRMRPENVAIMNSRILVNAQQHVFSRRDSYKVNRGGKIIELNQDSPPPFAEANE